MCKLVAELVGADDNVVRETFSRLELQSGNPGIDVRLTSEIYGKIHMKMRELGLDPKDTTTDELYHALLSLAEKHDSFLAKKIGIENPSDYSEVAEAVVRLLKQMRLSNRVWSLKATTIRRLLKKNPPKVLMKTLHYRSLDSMLKRESAAALLAVALHSEPAIWQSKMTKMYKELESVDFEIRNVEAIVLQGKNWQAANKLFVKRHSSILHNLEAGTIVFMPMNVPQHVGLTLLSLLLALHYLNEIRIFSSYGKFINMRPDFGNLLVKHLTNDHHNLFVAGHPLGWGVIHRYYGNSAKNHPEIFKPHVQLEDLAYRKAEMYLYRLEPALHFWHDLDYVGLPHTDGPISFNLADVAVELVNNIPLENRVSYHLRDAVWNEVLCRYIGQDNFERQIILQLEEHSIGAGMPIEDLEFAW